jgi:DNA topoisomerase-1
LLLAHPLHIAVPKGVAMAATATTSISPEAGLAPPEEAAEEAGLRYVTDDRPGITRERKRETWIYRQPDGTEVTSERTIRRIERLVIPPAWTDVWICTDPIGHLQATGRDARGRKQYRYHPRWRETRDENKFGRMIAFGEALPGIRERVEADLALPGLPRDKVLATVVRLLETTLIRVGNEQYVKENNSFGLTTLRNHHVEIKGSEIHFAFRGKSGVKHAIDLMDRRMARIVKQMRELPGYHLFQYIDEEGDRREVTSDDVNDYLHEIAGEAFTAKDFRTWAGTVLCTVALRDCEGWENETEAKRNVVAAVKDVASSLANTPAVCRKCYIHPAVIDTYLQGETLSTLWSKTRAKLEAQSGGLTPDEAAVLKLLRNTAEATAK